MTVKLRVLLLYQIHFPIILNWCCNLLSLSNIFPCNLRLPPQFDYTLSQTSSYSIIVSLTFWSIDSPLYGLLLTVYKSPFVGKNIS